MLCAHGSGEGCVGFTKGDFSGLCIRKLKFLFITVVAALVSLAVSFGLYRLGFPNNELFVWIGPLSGAPYFITVGLLYDGEMRVERWDFMFLGVLAQIAVCWILTPVFLMGRRACRS